MLGLKVSVINATFDTIIPGLASGKYDLGISSFTDTKEREKTVDFVTYFVAGTSFYVQVRAAGRTSRPWLTCAGARSRWRRARPSRRTRRRRQQSASRRVSRRVTVQVFNDQNAVNLALSSGRAQVAMADSPVAAYQVKQSNGTFKVTGSPYGTAPYGIAIPKDNGMADPVLAAVKHLMADGTYTKILEQVGGAGRRHLQSGNQRRD